MDNAVNSIGVSLSRSIARLLLARRDAGLPAELRAKARMHIADAVGISLAALHTTTQGREVIAGVSAGGASGQCSVIGASAKLPPSLAAFANSSLIHILDFDDIHDIARLHPSSATLPAALAAAELCGAPGAAVVDGVALGNELMCRLGLVWNPTGTGPVSDWFTTQLFGYMGATIAAGVVLNMSEDQLVSALGLAYMQAAGGKEAGFGVGATARAIYPAFAAMGGVHACMLARAGIVGPQGSLDGNAGLFRILFGRQADDQQLGTLLDQDAWLFRDTEIKPWPCCRLSHPYVAAAQALRKQLNGEPVRIDVAVNASAAKLCHPLAQRRRPQTLQDAKYSVPFMTAFALSRDTLDLSTINDSMLQDEQAHKLADLVEIAETLPDTPGHPPAEIVVTLSDGRKIASPGNWQSAIPEEAVHRKFNACLSHAGTQNADQVWQRLNHLDAELSVTAVLSSLH